MRDYGSIYGYMKGSGAVLIKFYQWVLLLLMMDTRWERRESFSKDNICDKWHFNHFLERDGNSMSSTLGICHELM